MLESLPVWPAYALTALLMVSLAFGALAIPRARVLEGAPDWRRWRDIRWWAVALLAVQLALYAIFS